MALLFVLILNIGNIASASTQNSYKIAIVDVPALIDASPQIKALKKEQQKKLTELQKWLFVVKADIDKQKTQEGKEKLIKKYDEAFAKKQNEIQANYAKKIQAIDKSIMATIEKGAKDLGYNMVLTKDTVLMGGDDITKELLKNLK